MDHRDSRRWRRSQRLAGRVAAVGVALGVAVWSPGQAVAACVTPPDDMIGWWSGDGHAEDIWGGHDGVEVGSTAYATGQVASAFSFPGGSFVDVQDGTAWSFGLSDFTIDLWANFDQIQGRDPFIGHDDGGGNQDKWIFWYDAIGHRAPGGPALRFHINGPSLGPLDPIVYPWSPQTGVWYHLAITRTGSVYKLYIDGALVQTENDSNEIQDAGQGLQIGAAESFSFRGLIDEVEIFNRALSDLEIAGIYGALADGKCKPINACETEGAPCDDRNACTEGDECLDGDCVGTLMECDGQCQLEGICNQFLGSCPLKENGTACEDGTACTSPDLCDDGVCAAGEATVCNDSNPCTTDGCDSQSGECEFDATPATGCLQAGINGLKIISTGSGKAKWKWKGGENTECSDFGDPSLDTDYDLCVYDGRGPAGYVLATSFHLPASASWQSADCKWIYKDKLLSNDGIKKFLMKPGDGKASLLMVAKGANTPLPVPFTSAQMMSREPDLQVQLLGEGGTCWESVFGAGSVVKDKGTKFKASLKVP